MIQLVHLRRGGGHASANPPLQQGQQSASLRPGQSATAEELIAFCRQQMAAYKYPRQVEFLDELPKTVSGKLLRRELRDRG